MLPALEQTLADLGIDLRGQANVHLDLEPRPSKSPRAFCAPIEVPNSVMLVIQPIGGKDDWEALFHEAGHTEHYANTSADLPIEARRLGDMAVTEGWAALLEQLVTEPAWLKRRLDVPRPERAGGRGRADRSSSSPVGTRRSSCTRSSSSRRTTRPRCRARYVELLSDALKFPVNKQSYLDDIDGSYYVIGYLRSWAFEAQLRDYLRESSGTTGSRAARPASCCASCGRSARARRPMTC